MEACSYLTKPVLPKVKSVIFIRHSVSALVSREFVDTVKNRVLERELGYTVLSLAAKAQMTEYWPH